MTTAEMILGAPPEERITLTELARQENVAPSTTWRWATKGSCQVLRIGITSSTVANNFPKLSCDVGAMLPPAIPR
jgi:hypothetical protein